MNARLKVIISMAIFGTVAIFVKQIPLPPGELSLYRSIIATLTLAIYKAISRKKISFRELKRKLPTLFISGAALGISWIFLFQAYNYTTVSIATLCLYFAPVLMMLFSVFLFKEKITLKQIVCFTMATIGLVLIIGVSKSDSSDSNLKGIIYGLIAATLYATVVILNKHMKDFDGIDRTLIQFIVSVIVLTPYVLKTSGINILSLNSTGLISLLILGALHTGFNYSLYFSSVKNLDGQEVAILSYVDPLVTIILSVIILKESINGIQLLGGAMILGFTLLNEVDTSKLKYKKE